MISIIIPTYTNLGGLAVCLQSLFLHEPDTSQYETLVVFDAGPAKIRKVLDVLVAGKPVRLIDKEKREGFSSAINAGVRYARSDSNFYILVNDDIEFVRPFINPILATFAEDPQIAIVGAKLWHPDGKIQHAGVKWNPDIGPCHLRHRSIDSPDLNRSRDCLVTGALFATRASVFREIGGFDEAYKMGYEDTEYAMQAIERGYRSVYRSTVMAIHAEGATRGKDTLDPRNEGFQRFKTRWAKYWGLSNFQPAK